MKKCASCGYELREVDVFCDHCGAGVIQDDLAADTGAVAVQCSEAVPVASLPPADEKNEVCDELSVEAAESAAAPSTALPVASSSGLLALKYNVAQIFVQGLDQVFKFEVTANVEDLKNVRVFVVRRGTDGVAWSGKSRKIRLSRGESRVLTVPYRASHAGESAYSIYVVCSCDGEEHTVEADEQLHGVYPKDKRVGEVVSTLQIDIRNNVCNNEGHANDYAVDNTLDGLADLKKQMDPNASVVDYIDRIANCGKMVELKMYSSTWSPDKKRAAQRLLMPVRLSSRPPKVSALTLCDEAGRCVHMIAAAGPVTFGKNRGNDVVTRIFNRDGQATSEGNRCLSRYHCSLFQKNGRIILQDGGVSKSGIERGSTCGTFIAGRKVYAKSEVPVDHAFQITLAGASADDEGAVGFDCEPWTCSGEMRRECDLQDRHTKRELSCLIMRRDEKVPEPEIFILVWGCCLAQMISPDLDGLVVWQQDGALAYATYTENGWLKPGMEIPLGDNVITVSEKHQRGL